MNTQEKADTEVDVEEAPAKTALGEKVAIEKNAPSHRRILMILITFVLFCVAAIALAASLSKRDDNESIVEAQKTMPPTSRPAPISTQAPTDVFIPPRTKKPCPFLSENTSPYNPSHANWSFPIKPGPTENASIVPLGSPMLITPIDKSDWWNIENQQYKAAITSNGNRVIVADEYFQVSGQQQTGAARIYDWNGKEWKETAFLQMDPSPDEFTSFGSMVAMDFSGNIVTVLAHVRDPTLHRFEIVDGLWTEMPHYQVYDMGMSHGLSGDGARVILGNNDLYGTSYLFKWDTTCEAWDLLDNFNRQHLDGCEAGYEAFGERSVMSADGNVVASGDPWGKCFDCKCFDCDPHQNCNYSPYGKLFH